MALGHLSIESAVTLRRRKNAATIGRSTSRALVLDHIEQSSGSGPCIDILESGSQMLLGDVRSDPRWPASRRALEREGVGSVLGVPMELDAGGPDRHIRPTQNGPGICHGVPVRGASAPEKKPSPFFNVSR